jgi:hypothetical protein
MSKFQQMKRQQAAAAAAASNKLPFNKNKGGATATADDDNSSLITALSSSTSSSPSPSQLVPLYPLPASSKDISRRRWNLDSSSSSQSSSSSALTASSLLASKDLTFPSGFLSGDYSADAASGSSSAAAAANVEKTAALVYQSAMSTATAPGKQLLMTAFMLWMSGNSLQIFSIMMLGMALYQPLQRLLNVSAEFRRYQGSEVNVLLPKLVFCLCNAAGVALALYKCNAMGLLPTNSADWLSQQVRPVREFAAGGATW